MGHEPPSKWSGRPASRLDIQGIASKIARAEERLSSTENTIPCEAAAVILEFVEARRSAVSPQRVLNYLASIRSAFLKPGSKLLASTSETPMKCPWAYREAKVWTQTAVRAVLCRFWKWWLQRQGQGFSPWLSTMISKRNANNKDHAEVLTPEEVARLADHAVNLREKTVIGQSTRVEPVPKRCWRSG